MSAKSRSPRKPDEPTLWIVAGPNGCGKSSLYNQTVIEGWGGSVWIINPDLLTAHIFEHEQLAIETANIEAVERIQRWLDTSVDSYQTIGVETVLSTRKYAGLVGRAKRRGFRVRMLYVLVQSLEVQIERIRLRVREGGHDVPLDKIAARRDRSFKEFAWYLKRIDDCYVFDNSGAEPVLVAAKIRGPLLWHSAELPASLVEHLIAERVDVRRTNAFGESADG